MKHTALVYDYVGTYRSALSSRRYDRGWYMDPSDFTISCADLPLSADEEDIRTDQNFLICNSYIDYLHGAAAYDIKFAVPQSDFENLVRSSRPMMGWESFTGAKQYAGAIRAGEYGGAGKSTALLYREKTFELSGVECFGPQRYPAAEFDDYLS